MRIVVRALATLLALAVPSLLVACAGARPAAREPGTTRIVDGQRVEGVYISPDAYQHYIQAQMWSLAGRSDQAMDELRRAIASDGSSPYLRTRLGEELMALGRLDEARDELQAALHLDVDFAEAYVDLGRVALQLGDAAQAERCFRRAFAVDRTLEDGYVALAALYHDRGDDPRADDVYRSLGDRVPRSAQAHYHLAHAAARHGDLALLERELRRALELDPGHADACRELGELLVADGRVDAAVKELEQCFDRSGGDVTHAGPLLAALAAAGRTDAQQLLLDTLVEQPSSWERRVAVGWLLLEHGRAAQALALADDLPRPAGREAPVLLLRGAALAELRRVDDAVAELKRIPPGAPEFPRAAVRIGRLLGDEGRFPEAVVLVARAVPFADHFADGETVIEALAELHDRAGDHRAARDVLERALRLRPTSDRLVLALGRVLDRAGEWERAVAVVRPVLRRRSDSVEAMRFIGAVLVGHRARLDEARKLLETAATLHPASAEVADALGWLYLTVDRVPDADRMLKRARRLRGDDPAILAHVGALYLKQGDRPHALEAYRRALAQHPEGAVRQAVEEQLLLLENGRIGVR